MGLFLDLRGLRRSRNGPTSSTQTVPKSRAVESPADSAGGLDGYGGELGLIVNLYKIQF